MNQNYNPESFKKGEQFENYVEKIIFPDAHYKLLDKTSDSKQNLQRYPKRSMDPDFKFESRVSGKIFYIEAKWRAKPYQDRYEVLSKKQFESFPKLDKEDAPIFIVFGYGGQANNPDYISLIPLNEVNAPKLSPAKVHQFNIKKTFYPPSMFFSAGKHNIGEEKAENHSTGKELKEKSFQKNKIYALASIGLIAILLSIYSFAFSESENDLPPKERLQHIVTNYYRDMNSNQIEKLSDYLSPKIDSWYGDKNPTQEEVIRNARRHRGKFPYSSSQIDWDSFTVIQQQNGNYHVSYEMIYKSKENINDDYTVYDLKLITKWDQDYKLKSITEIRKGDKT